MNNCFEDLETIIDDRIQSNYKKLQNSKSYVKSLNAFTKKYDYLYNKLNSNDKIILEEIHNLSNNINAKENYLTYLVGFIDGIKLDNYLGKN